MNKRSNREIETLKVRLLNIQELQMYIGVGRNNALNFGEESGAKIKIGGRTLYDKIVIDRYLDGLLNTSQKN